MPQFLSPDKQWMVVVCDPNNDDHTYTKVFRLDSTQSWEVPFYETYGITQTGPIESGGLKSGAMEIYEWSKDSRYLYLVPRVRYFDGNCLDFYSGPALYRLELASGKVSAILQPGPSFQEGYSFALSPDGAYLVYVSPSDGNQVHFFVTTSGEEITLQLGNQFQNAGRFVWSSDNQRIIFAAVKPGWCVEGGYTIFYYDLETGALTTPLVDSPGLVESIEWISTNEILIQAWEPGSLTDPVQYEIDLTSGEALPSPTL